jgi:predicted transcriptional regulator
MKRSVRIPDDLDAQIAARAERSRRSYSNQLVALLAYALDALEPKKAEIKAERPKIAPRS